MYRTVNKITLAALLLVALTLFVPVSSFAAEINPDPSSYSYGSTSEFSAYHSLNETSVSGDSNLADTGQSTQYFVAAASVLAFSAVLIVVLRKQKHLAK